MSKTAKNGKNARWWHCICDCGSTCLKLGNKLKSGRSTNCGCVSESKRKPKRPPRAKVPLGESAKRSVLNDYKQGARARGIEWDLDDAGFFFITKQCCMYCAALPSRTRTNGGGSFIYNGIDRLDSSQGYVLGNVVTCCTTCNYAKGATHVDDFLNWIERVYKATQPHFLSTARGSWALLPLN